MPGAPNDPTRMRSPWQSIPFRMLTLGGIVTSFGSSITPVAIAFAVLSLGGSATQLGLVVAAYAGAEIATIVVGGVLGDRLPRAALMQGSAFASAITQGILGVSLVQGWGTLGLLTVLSALTGIFGSLSSPSSGAMTQQTVPDYLLQKAITIRRLSGNTASVLGFSAGGMLVASIGPGPAIVVDAVTLFVGGMFYSLVSLPPPGAEAGHSLLEDAVVGAKEVFRHTWLWVLIVVALVYHLFYASAQGVLGPIVVQVGYGEAAWGWALAALMVGFMAGGVVTLRWLPRRALYAGTAFLMLAACFPAALAANLNLGLVLTGAFLHGFGLEMFTVAWELSIQENVDPDKLARVYGFDVLGSFVARPIGLALTGPIAETVGYADWLWIVTGVIIVTIALALTVPSVRALERRLPERTNDPDPEAAAG